MRKTALPLAIAAALTVAAHAPAADRTPASGRAIVEVATPSLPTGRNPAARGRWHEVRARSNAVLSRFADRNELEVRSRVPEIGQLGVALEGESIAELRRRLAADPRVELVVMDRAVDPRYAPNDVAFGSADPNAPGGDFFQWNLRRSGGVGAWDMSKGAGAEVAVVDTGAYIAHPDLVNRVVGTLDCDGGCGGTDVSDPNGHGTHVTGLACADSDNAYGVASLGFDCNLFVARYDPASCLTAAAAVVQAANRGSDAINMSYGCGTEHISAVNYAWSAGSVPVAAGANQPVPPPSYPAQTVQPEGSGPAIDSGKGLVVTAAKYDGTRAAFAQGTTGISVAAYGAASDQISGGQQGIISTFPPLLPPVALEGLGIRRTINGDNRFAYLVGTSMAAPQVAGLVALMRSANPGLSNSTLIRLVKLTASNSCGYANGIGWGVIDANRAVIAALGRDIDPPTSRVTRARPGKLKIKRFDGNRNCPEGLPVSGVRRVRVFVSRNGKKYRRLTKTKKKKVRFKPKRRGRYRFFTVAVDKAGNEEAPPERSDKKLRIKKRFIRR
jgi:subtilisin family serine protease